MNDAHRVLVKAAIFEMGLLFNQSPSDEKIKAYAKALENYSPTQITYAFKQVILSGSAFFPSLAEILKHLRPDMQKKEDLSPLIAKEIIQFLRTHHFDLEQDYLHTLSPDAREVFLAIGNSSDLRNSENFEVMNAQLERFIKGFLAVKGNHQKNDRLVQIGALKNNAGLRSLDFSSFAVESTHD